MDHAAVSQTIANWRLLSELKQSAKSVIVQGEEAMGNMAIFSRASLENSSKKSISGLYSDMIKSVRFTAPRTTIRERRRKLK